MGSNPIFCAKSPLNRQKRRFGGLFLCQGYCKDFGGRRENQIKSGKVAFGGYHGGYHFSGAVATKFKPK